MKTYIVIIDGFRIKTELTPEEVKLIITTDNSIEIMEV